MSVTRVDVERSRATADLPMRTPALVSLVVLAVLLLWYPLLRATRPYSIAYNEGWNTYWQQAAAGQNLYAAPPWMTIENYPPLSFHLIGWLGRIAGDTNLAGRSVALVSLGLVCGLAGWVAAHMSRSRSAGWYAGLCPLVWLGVYAPDRIGMNDPQFLGMVPELLGLLLYLRLPRSRVALAGSAILFALSVFTKQNLLACPVAVAADLVWSRNWRDFGVFSGIGLAAAMLLVGATIGVDGGYFLDHLLRARAADYATGRSTDIGYLWLFAPPILLSGAWAAGLLGSHRSRPVALGWAAAHGFGLLLAFGHGVASNILFEAIVFDAIVVPVACQGIGSRRGGGLLAGCLLMLSAVWLPALVPGRLSYGFSARQELTRAGSAFGPGIDLLRGRAGVAWCEDLLLCRDAGKPMVFDAYFVQDQIATGRLAECDVLRQLAAQTPALIEIGASFDRDPPLPAARLRFTARFMRTLLRYYAPVLRTRYFTVLEPAFGPWQDDGDCG